MSKVVSRILMVGLVLVVGVAAVHAADPATTPSPVFSDGRLNAYDAGAPIVVYEPLVSISALQADGLPGSADVIGGVQILKWNNDTANSSLALNISVEDISKAIAAHPDKDFTITTQNGVSLGYSQSGWFWVTSAPDSEGKVYSFTWEKNF